MEIRILKYFLTVAEEENITKAARRLHMTQPALCLENLVSTPEGGDLCAQARKAGIDFKAEVI